jgi:aspartate aminotransferase
MTTDPIRPAISSRLAGVAASGTVETTEAVRQMRKRGIDVIHFGSGDPDFDTPVHIREALERAVRDGFTHYTESSGLVALREAIAQKLHVENLIDANPGDEIIVTPSGKHALFCATTALVDQGDEVLIFDPSWVSYGPSVEMVGGVPVHVPLSGSGGFRIDEASIERHITPRSKLIIFNSPNNPTGRVHDRGEIEAVASVARRHDLYVLADEVYEKLVFDGATTTSIASLPGMAERTITVNSFSKSYAMTGWRLGYLAGPRRLVAEISKVQQHSVTCAPSFTQQAAIAALRGPQDCVTQMVEEFRRRRDRVAQALSAIPRLRFHGPEGTFYLFLDISGYGRPSAAFARMLLDQAHVAVTPGKGFGLDDHVRLALTQKQERLDEAVDRMARCLSSLDSR